MLVQRGSTRYAVDTGRGLSQILSDGTETYLYGTERLRATGGAWYLGDALGSVRATLDDSGAALGSTSYTPWGEVQSGTVPTFGFTGERQTDGLVHLRARWYNPGQGTLLGRDPFAGELTRPFSFHGFGYAYNDPVRLTDPTGYDALAPFGFSDTMDECFTSAAQRRNEGICRSLDNFRRKSKHPLVRLFVEGLYVLQGCHNQKPQPKPKPRPTPAPSPTPTEEQLGTGFVEYGALDFLGRATSMAALLEAPLRPGSSADERIIPPGWNALPKNNRARAHLLAKVLGGTGKKRENLIPTLQNPTNNSHMKQVENQVRTACSKNQKVIYIVKPEYLDIYGPPSEKQLLPVRILMVAESEDGKLNINKPIPHNVP